MRKILGAAMAAALIGAAAWWFTPNGDAAPSDLPKWAAIDPPRPAPALGFADAAGQPRTLADFRGRVVLLNLWATWCGPCIEEMPALDRLQARLGGPDFEVVALSLDREGREKVEPFMQRLGLGKLGLYLDPKSTVMGPLAVRGLPTTILIDREGRMVGKVEGAAPWDSPPALRLIEYYLGKGSGGQGNGGQGNGMVRTGG